jgi:hypothetical protein
MNSEDYNTKMKQLLDDPSYRPSSRDPTTYLEKTTKSKILESPIEEEIKKKLIPREKSSRCPKFYGLPKIHKDGVPLRPIVSAFNSPTNNLEKYLASHLQPIVEKANSYVKNSEQFTQILDLLTIDQNDILASFDVKSLYPSIPVDEALKQIADNEDLPAHIIDLSRHCLKNAYFMYDGQIYRQTDGAAMGSSLSPAVANLFMVYFEKKAIESANLKPKLWISRMVFWQEDTLKVFRSSQLHPPQDSFTLEMEENNRLPFLDVQVMKTKDGHLEHTVYYYRKPTHTNRYLNAESHHHPSQIQAVANTLISRSIRLTTDNHRSQELETITAALKQNGYKQHTIRKAIEQHHQPRQTQTEEPENRPKTILPYIKGTTDRIGRILRKYKISTTYKPYRTIRTSLKNPTQKIKLENHGIYSVGCGTCHKTYVGQTNRRISARLEEHKLAVKRKQTTSALFQHQHQTGHKINFDSCKQIATAENLKTRLIREAIEIEKNRTFKQKG